MPEWHHPPSRFDQLSIGLRDRFERWRHWSVRTLDCTLRFNFLSQFVIIMHYLVNDRTIVHTTDMWEIRAVVVTAKARVYAKKRF